MAATAAIGFVKGADGRYLYANAFLVEHLGQAADGDWRDKTDEQLWPDIAARIRADD